MKYKISTTPLKLKEYGRNIQSMVEHVKTIEDREYRSRVTQEIVRMMADINPHLKEIPDYKQKLWDHLFVIAGFDLDVESPFPKPEKEDEVFRKTARPEYSKKPPRMRQYGRSIELMIAKAIAMEEGDEKKTYVNLIAKTMKQFLRDLNRNSTPEEVIAQQMTEISKGELRVKPEDLNIPKNVQMKTQPSNKIHHTTIIRKKKKRNKNQNQKSRHKRK